MYGPTFACIVCEKLLFKRSVVKVDDNVNKNFLKYEIEHYANRDIKKVKDSHWICHNCEKYISKGKMPPTCSKNGLGVTDTPKELEGLYLVERHLISKKFAFSES